MYKYLSIDIMFGVKLSWFHNKSLFKIHSWLGLNFGLILFMICFSGTIATLSYEIDWLLNPPLWVTPSEKEELDFQTIADSVNKEAPNDIIGAIFRPRHPGFATTVYTGTSLDDYRVYCVNPYSGEIQGQISGFNLQRFFRVFHKQFFIIETPYTVNGVIIVGFFGLFLLFSAVTGILFYKNFWKRLFVLRFYMGLRTMISDMHRLLGVWSILFSLIFAITGIWYCLEVILRMTNTYETFESHHIDDEIMASYDPYLKALPIHELHKIAKDALPELDITMYRFPLQINEPVVFYGQTDALLVRDAANTVSINPYSGEVIDIQNAADMNALDRWVHTADPLHFGTWGGLITQILYFLFGLAISISILTGVFIYFIRMNNLEASKQPKRSFWGWSWTILSFAITMIILLKVSVFTAVSLYISNNQMSAGKSQERLHLGSKNVGPWNVDVFSQPNNTPGKTNSFSIASGSKSSIPNFKKAWFQIGGEEKQYPLKGTGTINLSAKMTIPEPHSETQTLKLIIQSWDGTQYHNTFPLFASVENNAVEKQTNNAYPIPFSVWIIIALYLLSNILIIIYWFRYVQWRV